jgi:ribonucleotide monophosphatase NagD (HAD superfamily)
MQKISSSCQILVVASVILGGPEREHGVLTVAAGMKSRSEGRMQWAFSNPDAVLPTVPATKPDQTAVAAPCLAD